jgi:hypothetical protein
LVEIESNSGQRALAREEMKAGSECLAKFSPEASFSQYGGLLLRARALWLAAALEEGPHLDALALEMRQFLKQALSLLGADNRDRAKLTVELANVAVVLGELQFRSNPNAAYDNWRQAEALLKPFVELRDGAVLTLMVRTRMHLGDLPAAQAFMMQVRDTSYRHPVYADLTKQLQSLRGSPAPSNTSGAKS